MSASAPTPAELLSAIQLLGDDLRRFHRDVGLRLDRLEGAVARLSTSTAPALETAMLPAATFAHRVPVLTDREALVSTLAAVGWVVPAAAKKLGLAPSTVYAAMVRLDVKRPAEHDLRCAGALPRTAAPIVAAGPVEPVYMLSDRAALVAALETAGWNVTLAAVTLQTTGPTVHKAMKRMGVERPADVAKPNGFATMAAARAAAKGTPPPVVAPSAPPPVVVVSPPVVKAKPRPLPPRAPASVPPPPAAVAPASLPRDASTGYPPGVVPVDALVRRDQSFACRPLGQTMLAGRCVDRQRDATASTAELDGDTLTVALATKSALVRCVRCGLGVQVAAKVAGMAVGAC